MTVKQLRELLTSYPEDVMIVLSRDAEGNLFSPLEEVNAGIYTDQTGYYGDFRIVQTLGQFNISHSPQENEAICFWPLN